MMDINEDLYLKVAMDAVEERVLNTMLNRLFRKVRNLVTSAEPKPAQILVATTEHDSAWGIPNPLDSDIYLISYPKSGNTWMRYLMTYAIWPEIAEVDLVEMAAYFPSFGLQHDIAMMREPDSPCNQLKHRLIKHHAPHDELASQHVKRAIYIARDGRDAIVSYWHFCNQRDGTNISFSDFIECSVKPEYFGPWNPHVSGWLHAPLEAKLILRYEDMLEDTAGCLQKALKFAEIEVPRSAIENAVRRASFDSMRKLEKTKGLNLEILKNVEFVRSGRSGTWLDTFGPHDLERFNQYHGGPIPELGYIW
ncbi:MAG: sulfotransferase domain-containing protein [Nitrosomonadales bacterium]|nr:sulfotransferase domain-containing protein [Nitrosomonadales bacterium]